MAQIKKIMQICHTKIYIILIHHPLIDVIVHAIRKRKDKECLRRMAERDGMTFSVETYGNKHQDVNLYYIYIDYPNDGFCANLYWLLRFLTVADRMGFVPVVEWGAKTLYADTSKILNTYNPYEYYFTQYLDIKLEDVQESYNVIKAQESHITDFFLLKEIKDIDGYLLSEEYISHMALIWRKYVILNRFTADKIDKEIRTLCGGETILAVHARGTDYKQNYNNHPIAITTEDFLETVTKLFETGRYDKIFLATDDETILLKFIEKFEKYLLFYKDVMRGKGKTSIALSKSTRERHRYLLGYEILRDMLTLASAEGLVAGVSMVSNCARIVKKSTGKDYAEKVILNKGINHNNNIFVLND